MEQVGSQDGPKRPQDVPKMGPRGSKMLEDVPRWVQDGPKMAPRCPKRLPRCSKSLPRWAQEAPRCVHRGYHGASWLPRWPQGAPRCSQDGLKRPPDAQRCSKMGSTWANYGIIRNPRQNDSRLYGLFLARGASFVSTASTSRPGGLRGAVK